MRRTPVSSRSAATRVTLLALGRAAPWAHLAAVLCSSLAEGDIGSAGAESLGGLPSGDLFAVANAISALLDARSRSRTAAPECWPSRVLTKQGVFRHLHRSDRPIFITPPMPGDTFTQPSVAVAVRAGDEMLGSVRAAVPGPLSDERTEALCDAAKLVALRLLRVRAGADVQRRLRVDLLSTALKGGVQAREARERLSDAFAMHLSAVHPKSASALITGVAYGLLPVHGPDEVAEERDARISQEFPDRVGDRHSAVVGIGPSPVTSPPSPSRALALLCRPGPPCSA